jgi:hypothetical protein
MVEAGVEVVGGGCTWWKPVDVDVALQGVV